MGAPTLPLPNPPALWLRRAKPGYAYAIMGTLGGFPNPRPLGTRLTPLLPRALRGLAATHHPPFGSFGTLGPYPPPTTPLAALGLATPATPLASLGLARRVGGQRLPKGGGQSLATPTRYAS